MRSNDTDLILLLRCSGTGTGGRQLSERFTPAVASAPVPWFAGERFHEANSITSVPAKVCAYAYEHRELSRCTAPWRVVLNPSISLGACERPCPIEPRRSHTAAQTPTLKPFQQTSNLCLLTIAPFCDSTSWRSGSGPPEGQNVCEYASDGENLMRSGRKESLRLGPADIGTSHRCWKRNSKQILTIVTG